MTDAISTKLLAILAITVLAAGFGAWKLLGAEAATGDIGFGQADELPIFVPEDTDEVTPITESVETTPRNPFERIDPTTGSALTPIDVPLLDGETASTAEGNEPAAAVANPEPVFPDPGLVDQEPSGAERGDPRDDTSFEG